ncbi:MAG TPA: arginase [Bryobacteraceae bacterium]|nr:arginase [Bryobacteraceae bacterium]
MRKSHIAIIGAPLDLGSGRRGVDMGPSAVRVANLNGRLVELGYIVDDLGNVPVVQPESQPEGSPQAKYLPQITDTCVKLADMVTNALAEDKFPLVLGGDHSIAVGTVSGVSKHIRERKGKLGMIWIDAHTDMNTPASSPSGNVHGMPLACCIGAGPDELTRIFGYSPKVDPANVALVGIRSVDDQERINVQHSGVHVFTMREIDERGLLTVIEEAIRIASSGTAGFHVSLDMDAVDPQEAPGVGTPVRGGVTYREAHLAMETLNDSDKMVSMEVVEVNPVIDEANRTAVLAVELVMSAMGKRIL